MNTPRTGINIAPTITRAGGRSISLKMTGMSANTRRATELIQRSFVKCATNDARKNISTVTKAKAKAAVMDTGTTTKLARPLTHIAMVLGDGG